MSGRTWVTAGESASGQPAGPQYDTSLLYELLNLYFPRLRQTDDEEAEEGAAAEAEAADANTSGKGKGKASQDGLLNRQEVQESLQWFEAFSGAATGGKAGPRSALAAGRARFELKELRTLRPPGNGAAGASDIATRLAKRPDVFLAEVGLGLHLAAASPPSAAPRQTPAARIDVEVVAPELERPVKSMCSELIDHYIGLRGNVIRAGSVSPYITKLCFTCSKCGGEFSVPTKEGRFEWPNTCSRKCRFSRFSVNREKCAAIDWQRIRLQEDFLEFSTSGGPTRGMPRTVDCDMKRGLVGSCVPGDAVTLYGIIRFMPTGGVMGAGGEGRQAPNKALYVLFLDVRAVVNSRRPDAASAAEVKPVLGVTPEPEEDFSPLQLEFIREIYQERELLPLLVSSFCPQIYGQPLVKAALLLALLGGVPLRTEDAEQSLRRRGDLHVLLLGDPGLGKSELLRALAQLSTRGVYVSGNSSTSAGLTASVVRDSSGEMALEAGALVLADNGLCCIDEFDKMGQEQQALLEAMEQQSVSIAKAGIVCSLPARTTVVTAANPSKGTWDRTLTYAQNLKGVMTEALMSRFDVVFLMSDAEKQQSHESALTRHIVQRRMSGTALAELADIGGVPSQSLALVPLDVGQEEERVSLKDRCARAPQDGKLPHELLSTYLRYARRYARPRLGAAAQRRIKQFYVDQRTAAHNSSGQMAVTPRQLEALIRLSEARAKAELRRVVLASDVEDVIEIVRAGSDFEESLPDAPVRKGKSKPNTIADQLRQYMERRIRSGHGREFRESELLEYAKSRDSIKEQDFDKALQKLNEQENVLLLRSSGSYEFTGAV